MYEGRRYFKYTEQALMELLYTCAVDILHYNYYIHVFKNNYEMDFGSLKLEY